MHLSAGSTLPPSTYSPSTTPNVDGSTLRTLKPSTNIVQKQMPSEQVMRESVIMKVKNMDLRKVFFYIYITDVNYEYL